MKRKNKFVRNLEYMLYHKKNIKKTVKKLKTSMDEVNKVIGYRNKK